MKENTTQLGGFTESLRRKLIVVGVALVILIAIFPKMTGINDAGERTVLQLPTGKLLVKFQPGFYIQWFGKITKYSDVITFDFDKTEADAGGSSASLDQKGITVRYQDGGGGTIYGKCRYQMPNEEQTMLELHKAFRTNNGVAQKLIKPVTEEAMNLTAGLMTSEQAYAEKRSIFTQWSGQQIAKGKFKTTLKEVTVIDDVTGKTSTKSIPEIKLGDDGLPEQDISDLAVYMVEVSGYQITDWDFEPDTLAQIQKKREATMAIITAKANAEKAKQDEITAEAEGKAQVMTAKYEEEVEKQKAVTKAEQEKEVAVIAAEQKVEIAAQEKAEQEERVEIQKLKALEAEEYKKEQISIGEGDGERKKLVMDADGALEEKLAVYESVNLAYAEAIQTQKWVPDIMFGSGNGDVASGSSAQDMIQLLMVKTAKDLQLDMSLPEATTPSNNE